MHTTLDTSVWAGGVRRLVAEFNEGKLVRSMLLLLQLPLFRKPEIRDTLPTNVQLLTVLL